MSENLADGAGPHSIHFTSATARQHRVEAINSEAG